MYDVIVKAYNATVKEYDVTVEAHDATVKAYNARVKAYDVTVEAHDVTVKAYDCTAKAYDASLLTQHIELPASQLDVHLWFSLVQSWPLWGWGSMPKWKTATDLPLPMAVWIYLMVDTSTKFVQNDYSSEHVST